MSLKQGILRRASKAAIDMFLGISLMAHLRMENRAVKGRPALPIVFKAMTMLSASSGVSKLQLLPMMLCSQRSALKTGLLDSYEHNNNKLVKHLN